MLTGPFKTSHDQIIDLLRESDNIVLFNIVGQCISLCVSCSEAELGASTALN